MRWQTILLTAEGLTAGLTRIRAAGGTLVSSCRCAEGYRVTCTFPSGEWTSGAGVA